MDQNLINSLVITALGMGLVFASILLLWGGIILLVKLVKSTGDGSAPPSKDNIEEIELYRKRKAAATAVAIALAHQSYSLEPHEFPLPPTAFVSAWQAVLRTRMLNKRGNTK